VRSHNDRTLAVLVAAGMSYAMMQSTVIPALPQIQRTLHASETSVSWLLTAYLLSASVATPIIGRLGDMYGKERLLVVVLAVLAAGTLVCAVASSIGPMIAGRVIQGAGSGIFPLAFGIIRDEFPRERVPHGIGLMSSLLGVGGGLGLVLAGPILEHASFHWLFWLPLGAVLATLFAAHRWVPVSPIKVPGAINWVAGVLLALGLVVLLTALSQTSAWGWGSPRALGGMGLGLLILGGWVLAEARSPHPLVDMRMMRVRGVWTANVVALLVGFGLYASFILVPRFLQEPEGTGYGAGASVMTAALFLLPQTVTLVLTGQFTGRIERRVGSRTALLAGCGLTVVAFGMLVADRSGPWPVCVACAISGAGICLTFSALANLVVESVPQEQTGVATGMNTVMRTLGGAFGGQLAATLLASDIGAAGEPTSRAYGVAFGLCAAAVAAGLVLGLLVPRRRPIVTAALGRPATSLETVL
jgi:EmrB/QacA subfamily drug resistance transporter